MLETAVGDSAQNLGLQEEITEARGVDADVGALLVDIAGSGRVGLLAAVGGGGVVGGQLLIGVVDQILFGRHGDDGYRYGRVRRDGQARLLLWCRVESRDVRLWWRAPGCRGASGEEKKEKPGGGGL